MTNNNAGFNNLHQILEGLTKETPLEGEEEHNKKPRNRENID